MRRRENKPIHGPDSLGRSEQQATPEPLITRAMLAEVPWTLLAFLQSTATWQHPLPGKSKEPV